MSSINKFDAVYEEFPDHMIEDEANELEIKDGGTREGMVTTLPQVRSDYGVDKPNYVEVARPLAINTTVADLEPAEPVAAAPAASPKPPETSSTTPVPASSSSVPISPAKKPATHIEALLSLYPSPRKLSWADEKEEEEQAAAAAQAEVQATQEKEAAEKALQEAEDQAMLETQQKEAGDGWQEVKKPKKRKHHKNKVTMKDAGSPNFTPAKHNVASKPTAPASGEKKVELAASAVETEAVGDVGEVVEAANGDVPAQDDESVLSVASEDSKGSQLLGEDDATTGVAFSTSIAPEIMSEDVVEAITVTEEQNSTVISKDEETVTEKCEARTKFEEKTEAGMVAPTAEITPSHQHMETSGVDNPVAETAAASANEPTGVFEAAFTAKIEGTGATGAATVFPMASTKKKVPRLYKREKAAEKAEIALTTSLSSSNSVEKTSDGVFQVSENFQELKPFVKQPSRQVATVSNSPVATVAVEPGVVPAASSETAVELSTPAAAAATTDSWDDWIEQVPTFESCQWQAAYEAMYDAEEEAQARYAAGLPPLDHGIVTAAELQRRHEEAECARQTEVTSSTPVEEVVNTTPEEPEDLQEPKIEVQNVDSSAVPTSQTTTDPPIATAEETEVLPAPGLGAQEMPSEDPRQLSILDFFQKAAVVTVEKVLSTASPESIASPAKLVTAVASQSEISSESVEGEVMDSINVADYLDYQPDTDGEEDVAEVILETSESPEDVPAASITVADIAHGQHIFSKPAVASLAQRIDDEDIPNDAIVDDDNTEVAQEAASPSSELVVARQKKKRSKAQRNAAKKRTAAAAAPVPDVIAEEEVLTCDPATAIAKITAPKPIAEGRTIPYGERTSAKCSRLDKDATYIEVSLAENAVTQPEVEDAQTLRRDADALLATILGRVSAWFRRTDSKQKAPTKTQKKPKPMSLGELTESYNLMITQGQVPASNRGLKKFKHDEAAQHAKGARLGLQPGLSATTKAWTADLDEERAVVAEAKAEAKAVSMPVNWWAAVIILVPILMLRTFWVSDGILNWGDTKHRKTQVN